MNLSRKNRRGILWLLIVGVVIAYSSRVYSFLTSNEDLSISIEELKQIEEEISKDVSSRKASKRKNQSSKRYKTAPGKFDPNKYKVEDWMNLGLSEKQSKVVLKFAQNEIRSNSDLKKIFVLPNELYELIKDSTFYPVHIKEFDSGSKKKYEIIELNNASKKELESLPGIGPYFADKIIERRIALGGYVEVGQLLEIWNFDNEKLVNVRPFVKLKGDVDKISINRSSINELKSHPYIDYKVANSIVKMRMANGLYSNIQDIKTSKLIGEELFQKIKPYLEL